MHINFPLVLRKMVGIKTPESYFATVAHFTPKTAFFLAGIKRVTSNSSQMGNKLQSVKRQMNG